MLSDQQVQLEFEIYNPTLFNFKLNRFALQLWSVGGSLAGDILSGHQSEIPPNSTTAFHVKFTLESAFTLGRIASEEKMDLTGDIGISMLGFDLAEFAIPRIRLSVDQLDLTWLKGETTMVDKISDAYTSLTGYMAGNCICAYNCANAPAPTCSTMTGGNCAYSACDTSRNAICWQQRCICKDDECAVGGVCVARDVAMSANNKHNDL